MKFVIFGGSFDPWTSAHQEITERLSACYDRVLVIPTAVRYYKANTQMFTFDQRFEAAAEKTASLGNVSISDIERNVDGSWRFVNTLEKVIERNGKENEYFVAIGSDSLQNFTTWYQWEKILELSKLVVFNRPGYTGGFPDIPYKYLPMENRISSTEIRKKIFEGK